MRKASASVLTLAASFLPMAGFLALDKQSATAPDFDADILPILRAHCSPCHTGDKTSGGLSLNSFDSLKLGDVVTPGSAARSVLVQRILGEGGLPRMPMGFKPLSEGDVSKIRRWIDSGAKPPDPKRKKAHWAFLPPVKAPVPKGWSHPIDAFVRTRLKKERLVPSPRADKVTLIRRLSLDLIGLPPTPSEVDAFLADASADAYERVVDRLLASKHYGERMALPWLDAARYADSNGFQQDGDTHQYVWRDWVVRALNANMPFDRFTIEQLAGDLLPDPSLDQLVATGFNRNHMLNGEGGAIPEEQRNVNLFDRVDTTASTWLNLTMACTRCHDHKYDPLTQRDYFSMMAYFNRVPESGVPSGSGQYRIAEPWVYAGTPAEMKRWAALKERLAAQTGKATTLRSSAAVTTAFVEWKTWVLDQTRLAEASSIRQSAWQDLGSFKAGSFAEAFGKEFPPEHSKDASGPVKPELADGKVHRLDSENTAYYFARAIEAPGAVTVSLLLGSDDGIKVWLNGREVLSRQITRAAVPMNEAIRVALAPGRNDLRLKIVNGGGIGGFVYELFASPVPPDVLDSLRSGRPADEAKAKEAFLRTDPPEPVRSIADLERITRQELARLESALPRVMVMSDRQKRDTFVLNRGNYEEPTEKVDPTTPASLPKASGPKNRLGLAKWIVSPQNPLTARVQVNRAWQLFFGRGLVRTEENFGVKGEPPTHPELLDWLAVDFRENGWNVKRLHKQIVMSETYRQSSKVRPELISKDPENRLYARAARFRMPSMILRDVALAASGLLDPKLGGKPVYPYQPKGIWDGLAITLERDFTYPQSKGSDNHRRSLYTFWRRTAAPGNMFDSSSRQVCTVKPTLTSTPLHALTMLNDVTWVEAGVALADSLMGTQGDEAKLKMAFRRICGRTPKPDELATLHGALAKARRSFRADPSRATEYVKQGDYQPKGAAIEAAALGAVCTAIFNLDEAMTRE